MLSVVALSDSPQKIEMISRLFDHKVLGFQTSPVSRNFNPDHKSLRQNSNGTMRQMGKMDPMRNVRQTMNNVSISKKYAR